MKKTFRCHGDNTFHRTEVRSTGQVSVYRAKGFGLGWTKGQEIIGRLSGHKDSYQHVDTYLGFLQTGHDESEEEI